MTRGDWRAFRTAETCQVCDKPLEGNSVRDHCHITGKYRGAAHTTCNLKLRLSPKTTTIPVVFHNLRGYDSHLLMQAISKVASRVHCIPNNTEKYISFSLGQLRFIDSVQFLLASLDRLVAANRPEAFRITARHEPDRKRLELLLRKGVYPYEYMDNWGCFTEPKLPPKEAFYSKLSDAHISNKDYADAQKVWKAFGCKTLGEYSDLYCRTDVLLLADVFEMFRKTCLHQYGLDLAHYYTSPGLSWDALLKKTGIELELLTDYDQHLFIEKGMRGGISMASKRYAKANNSLVEGHILYLIANNLYGWAMSQHLPVRGFRWVDDCQQLAKTIAEQPADGPEGYILGWTWSTQRTYTMPTIHIRWRRSAWWWRRGGCRSTSTASKVLGWRQAATEVEKLVPNLRNKSRYVLHYRNLQLYMSPARRLLEPISSMTTWRLSRSTRADWSSITQCM